MIAKRIKPKRRFVKLFEQINFVTLLHVYDAYGKTKNILHVGLEPSTCSKVAKFLTIGATCSICLNVHLSIFIYLLAQHSSRRCPFTRVAQHPVGVAHSSLELAQHSNSSIQLAQHSSWTSLCKIRGKKDALSGKRTHIHRPDVAQRAWTMASRGGPKQAQ